MYKTSPREAKLLCGIIERFLLARAELNEVKPILLELKKQFKIESRDSYLWYNLLFHNLLAEHKSRNKKSV
jgi:hypothetical protein